MADIKVPTRDGHRAAYLKSYLLRAPAGTDVGARSQPDVEARADADVSMTFYAAAQTIAASKNLIGSTGQDLLDKAAAAGIDDGLLPAVGARGYVLVAASRTGGYVAEGSILVHTPSKQRYQVTVGDTYFSGNRCAIAGIDAGPQTNLPIGTVLDWDQEIPGILPTAEVTDDGLGQGLTGGRPAETEDELIQRIIDARKYPATAGNAAQYRQAAQRTPTLGVERAYSFEAVLGSGTIAIAATMRPLYPGASRMPNSVQLATIEAHLLNSGFPGDDGIMTVALGEVPVDVHLGVEWSTSASGWVNQTVWPLYVNGDPVRVSAVTSSTSFTIETSTTTTNPKVGQVIGFYNPSTRLFVRKQIATINTITSGKKWAVSVATAGNASDVSYTPRADAPGAPGQVVSPWSESLKQLIDPLLVYFGTLGPGEMFSIFADEGTRQKRQPASPESFPHVISSRDLSNTPPKAIVSDVVVYQPAPNGQSYTTPVGVPGIIVYLLVLGDFAVFKKS